MEHLDNQSSVADAALTRENHHLPPTRIKEMLAIEDNDTGAAFDRLHDTLKKVSSEADIPMQSIDGYIQRLNDLGLFHRSIVCGPIAMTRSYGVEGPSDSGQLVQAGVTTELGSVAIFWDSEDFCEANQSQAFEEEAMMRAVALCDCTPAIRSIVWPHIAKLVDQLMSQIVIE